MSSNDFDFIFYDSLRCYPHSDGTIYDDLRRKLIRRITARLVPSDYPTLSGHMILDESNGQYKFLGIVYYYDKETYNYDD